MIESKIVDVLKSIPGAEEFVEVLNTPDIIFDAIYPSLRNTIIDQFQSDGFRVVMKDLQKDPEFQETKKEIPDIILAIGDLDDLSPNKKDLMITLFSAFMDVVVDTVIPIQKMTTDAVVPSYAHQTDAGADLASNEDIIIPPNSYGNLVKTGVAVAIPEGWLLSIRPRSGVSKNTTLRISNSPGTIDSGYRGEIGILVDNIGSAPVAISKGYKIAQMLLERSYKLNWVDVEDVTEIGEDREGGFGSTGTH